MWLETLGVHLFGFSDSFQKSHSYNIKDKTILKSPQLRLYFLSHIYTYIGNLILPLILPHIFRPLNWPIKTQVYICAQLDLFSQLWIDWNSDWKSFESKFFFNLAKNE